VFGVSNDEGIQDATTIEHPIETDGINDDLIPEDKKVVDKRVVREDELKRTSNSKHYLLADGSYQAVISGGDVHYEDENGEFQDINTSLVDEADLDLQVVPLSKEVATEIKLKSKEIQEKRKKNSLDRSETDFRALQVPFDVKLPKEFDKGYSVGKGEDKLSFIPIGANSVTGTVYGQDSLLYSDVWVNTDVELKIVNNGLKETMIAKGLNSPSSFLYEVSGNLNNDMTAGQLQIQPAWLEDASGVFRDVETRIFNQGKKIMLELIANYDGLSFPVKIDPTITINTPTADSYINEYYPNINYGLANSVQVGYSTETKALIKFNTSSLPLGIQIELAEMILFGPVSEDIAISNHIPYLISEPWNESTVTWNTQPNYNTSIFGSNNYYENSSFQIWNITSMLKMWLSNTPNYGLMLMSTTFNKTVVQYSSKDNPINATIYAPKLKVNYTFDPIKPLITSPNGGELIDGNHLLTWNAATDLESPQSSLKYHIQLSTDGGSSWSDIVLLTSAGITSYTYNFSNISMTLNALIRIRAWDGGGYGTWDQSDAPFTIKHNTIPNAPTNTSPGGTISTASVMVGSLTPTLTWTFTDPDVGNTQSAYKVTIYRTTDNVLISDSNWVSSTLKSYTVPSGKLTRGTAYYWQVQVRDNFAGTSPLSANKYIKTNRLPTLAITSYTDGQTIPDNLLTFTWTFNDLDSHTQTKFQVQGSKDNWATIAYNSGEITSSTLTHSSTFSQGEWDFRIRALDGYEWSAWAIRNNLLLPSSFEPNDTIATAFNMLHDQNYTTLISSTSDLDFYKFTSNKTGIDRVTLTVPTGKNYGLFLYDSSLNLLAVGPKIGNEDVLIYVQSGQTYYVAVTGMNIDYSLDPYTLRVVNFGNINGMFQTEYQYDSNGNLINKQTTTE